MGRHLTIGLVVMTVAVACVMTGCCEPVMNRQKQTVGSPPATLECQNG